MYIRIYGSKLVWTYDWCIIMKMKGVICLLFIRIISTPNCTKVYHDFALFDKKYFDQLLAASDSGSNQAWRHDDLELWFKAIETGFNRYNRKNYSKNMPTIRFDNTKFFSTQYLWMRFINFWRSTKSIHIIILKQTQYFSRHWSFVVASIRELNEILPRPKVVIVIDEIEAYSSLRSNMKENFLRS